jgi:hypothetical protein
MVVLSLQGTVYFHPLRDGAPVLVDARKQPASAEALDVPKMSNVEYDYP